MHISPQRRFFIVSLIVVCCIGALIFFLSINRVAQGCLTPMGKVCVQANRVTTKSVKPDILVFGTTTLSLRVARTVEEREKGLSHAEHFGQDEAMLFVFETSGEYGIWMKDMDFPIDIVWLDAYGKVVDFEQSVAPETFPEVFYPRSKASFVVETRAGVTSKASLALGSSMYFISK